MSAETKSVGKWISFLHRQFQVYINHEMKPYNINSSEYIYLAELGKDEGVNQSYFTESLSIDPALTTRVMKTLEEKGFITRTKDEHDKRAVLIRITSYNVCYTKLLRRKTTQRAMAHIRMPWLIFLLCLLFLIPGCLLILHDFYDSARSQSVSTQRNEPFRILK